MSVRAVLAALRDPGRRACLVLVLLAVAAFATLVLAWEGAAATTEVPYQLPWLLSGGFGGLAVLGLALLALDVHLARRADAVHRARVDDLVREACLLVEHERRRLER